MASIFPHPYAKKFVSSHLETFLIEPQSPLPHTAGTFLFSLMAGIDTVRSGPETLVDVVQQRATEHAATPRALQEEFKSRMESMLGGDGANALPPEYEKAFRTRLKHISDAYADAPEAKLEDHEPGVQGTNTLGEGITNMTLSREEAAEIRDEESAERQRLVIAHEATHGKTVELEGMLLPGFNFTQSPDVHLTLVEGWAEYQANKEMGIDPAKHREGQPKEVYGEGQDLIVKLVQMSSEQQVRDLLEGHGNLFQFQIELIEQGNTDYVLAV